TTTESMRTGWFSGVDSQRKSPHCGFVELTHSCAGDALASVVGSVAGSEAVGSVAVACVVAVVVGGKVADSGETVVGAVGEVIAAFTLGESACLSSPAP